MLVPLLSERAARDPGIESQTHRTIPEKTASGTAVKAAHTNTAITRETLLWSGCGDAGLTPMLLTELHAP
jgi:hypothetical protein